MTTVILLAGGIGKRVGLPLPKQFISIAGKPVISHTLERLDESPVIDRVVVSAHRDYLDHVHSMLAEHPLNKPVAVVSAGDTFLHSFKNGVDSLADAPDDEVVVLHMSTAPLVPEEVISDAVAVCRESGNAFSAAPSYLCMCQADGGAHSETPLDRDLIWGLNTPQAVLLGKLRELFARAKESGYDLYACQHLSTLLFDFGERVHFSRHSPINIKITTREDLALCDAYIHLQSKQHGEQQRSP
ncbi:MAG: 2-C-methyl-D-erythritol 4-phosphate cytidylyltransferase [Actinomycetia bacterium]|nr:2-C-methyl-D-erythritol 4-phosphate cytidylyltransferase [Actinomycetes bacterium]